LEVRLSPAFVGLSVLAIVGSWLYYAGFEKFLVAGYAREKSALNLAVTDMYGARISFGRAIRQIFFQIVTELIPLKIGYILAGITERKQALHDMIASTLVLRR